MILLSLSLSVWIVGGAHAATPDATRALGQELFLRTWVEGDPRAGGDGLGPLYNEASCVVCHGSGGVGGAGDRTFDVLLAVPVSGVPTPVHKYGAALPRAQFLHRNTTALFGAGSVDAIPDAVLLAQAAKQAAPLSGRVARTSDGGIGRFGWKADVASLRRFVELACAVELGLTVVGGADMPADLQPAEVDALTAYVSSIPRPVETPLPTAPRGREVFAEVGCAGCHVPELGAVPGLYSDLLVHEMGFDLADPGSYYGLIVAGSARGDEWRTPPLWGLRDTAPYLHDGRAATIDEAILGHAGEAASSVTAYRELPAADAAALDAFLVSLSAP